MTSGAENTGSLELLPQIFLFVILEDIPVSLFNDSAA